VDEEGSRVTCEDQLLQAKGEGVANLRELQLELGARERRAGLVADHRWPNLVRGGAEMISSRYTDRFSSQRAAT